MALQKKLDEKTGKSPARSPKAKEVHTSAEFELKLDLLMDDVHDMDLEDPFGLSADEPGTSLSRRGSKRSNLKAETRSRSRSHSRRDSASSNRSSISKSPSGNRRASSFK